MQESYDAIIIGAGQAGPPLVGRLTAAGMTVALVERNQLGGTCLNTGCTPTKTLVASAHVAHLARSAADYGIVLPPGPITADMPLVKARVEKIIHDGRDRLTNWLTSLPGCTLVTGHAQVISANTISVENRRLSAPRIFINVGGRANIPPIPGLDRARYLTNATILHREVEPEHLIILGGSYVGLEYAQIHRRFGARVTVVERGPHLVGHEDEHISEEIRGILAAEGIDIHTSAECLNAEPHADGVAVTVKTNTAGTQTLTGSHFLLATGRKPNTDDLNLAAAGVALDERGHVVVDDFLSTNVTGIWALGDCNGRGAFTHTSYNDYEIVANNLLDAPKTGRYRRVSERIRGYALYIDPPLGRVGLSEREARAAGRPILVAQRPMTRVGRAVEKGETQGLMKIVVDAETRKILGAAILGPGGDEAIHGILDIMNAGVTYDVLQWAVPIHPTVSELIPTLLGELKPA